MYVIKINEGTDVQNGKNEIEINKNYQHYYFSGSYFTGVIDLQVTFKKYVPIPSGFIEFYLVSRSTKREFFVNSLSLPPTNIPYLVNRFTGLTEDYYIKIKANTIDEFDITGISINFRDQNLYDILPFRVYHDEFVSGNVTDFIIGDEINDDLEHFVFETDKTGNYIIGFGGLLRSGYLSILNFKVYDKSGNVIAQSNPFVQRILNTSTFTSIYSTEGFKITVKKNIPFPAVYIPAIYIRSNPQR